jgi:predicted dehydrogenase
MNQMRVGLVGAGTMGANHARVIAESDAARLSVVLDKDLDSAAVLAGPAGADITTDLDAVARCDAAIVACPTEHHAAVALELIELGVPVLVEKPLAADLGESKAIVDASERHDVPLLCGFVERFNAAVVTATGLLDEPPVHILSIRHSPPTPRITTSVVYDLLIHDIDLAMRFLDGAQVESVSGAGAHGLTPGVTEVADCSLRFGNGAVATLSASRLSQRKIRSLLLTTSTALVDVDLLRQDVTVYSNTSHEQLGSNSTYRSQTTVDIPFVRHKGEPLALQFEQFLRLVRGAADPAAERATVLGPHAVAYHVDAAARREPSFAGAMP